MYASQQITFHVILVVSAMNNIYGRVCVCKTGHRGAVGGNELLILPFFSLQRLLLLTLEH